MEENPIARIQEQHDGGEQRGSRTEDARREKPGDDRGREQERHHGLRERAAREVEQAANDQHGDRRASEHETEIDRVGVEELDIAAEIGAEIATGPEGDHERFEPPDGERKHEDDPDAPACLDQRHSAPGESRTGLAEGAHGSPE